MLKIHLGDQTDSKTLLGTYVCTQTPGVFRWQPGLLTLAVSEGRWILIEDIDLAPSDVLSVLLPLLETRELFLASRGERIHAASGFQLFATRTTDTRKASRNVDAIGQGLWVRVPVEPLSQAELRVVLGTRYPRLSPLVDAFVEIFCLVGRQQRLRPISARDLMKWGRRVDCLLAQQRSDPSYGLSGPVLESLLTEALDCFCAMVPDVLARRRLTVDIGLALNMTMQQIESYLAHYKPEVESTSVSLRVGRATLFCVKERALQLQAERFTLTKHALCLMERLAVGVQLDEPMLLVGETGTGKTSVVQFLARRLGQRLLVINMSQQSDSADLIGGFKPVEVGSLISPLMDRFEALFARTFSVKNNREFIKKAQQAFAKKAWTRVLAFFRNAVTMAEQKFVKTSGDAEASRKMPDRELATEWRAFSEQLTGVDAQREQIKNHFLFAFVEGVLLKAVREGYWVLLDEINLATTETLECLSGLLEGARGSLLLLEKGGDTGADAVVRKHPQFRLFACMNPATDIGKRDLPPGLRSRFTEFYVDDVNDLEDLAMIARAAMNTQSGESTMDMASAIVSFYDHARQLSRRSLYDGANQRPTYSLRTLSRALEYACFAAPYYGMRRALYEGLSMTFLTQLNRESAALLQGALEMAAFGGDVGKTSQSAIKAALGVAPKRPGETFELIENFWIERGSEPVDETWLESQFILTPSVSANLRNLCRVVVSRKYPILIQGPTSSGKTSIIEYLAKRTGHRFVRINNHEHTDLQEYLGTYVSNPEGHLVFQEGVLVEAVRNGYWLVLDELNLAPSDVLEALNRLLDDNRELFIPETQTTVRPHPHFVLFATQNPPGVYGGRKVLSRAFRNRFLELQFDEIPEDELETILEKRSRIAPSYCKKLVAIFKDLQSHRQGTRLFAGKHGFITLRDLFRWAGREPGSWQELADEGYMLLAERIRQPEEKLTVKAILEKHLKCKIDEASIYLRAVPDDVLQAQLAVPGQARLVWTRSMRRLYALVSRCVRFKEPVLLVGETGCGKTTICQVLAALEGRPLLTLNCHQNTETADFLGSQRPARDHERHLAMATTCLMSFVEEFGGNTVDVATLIDEASLPSLGVAFDAIVRTHPAEARDARFDQAVDECRGWLEKSRALFEWVDGPLIRAMKSASFFLLDEISLAEDSVLERLNSVLEPSRRLVLAEKGGVRCDELTGADGFHVFATMNPGGDYGKKELSPALRNRFTEIWVSSVDDPLDIRELIETSSDGVWDAKQQRYARIPDVARTAS